MRYIEALQGQPFAKIGATNLWLSQQRGHPVGIWGHPQGERVLSRQRLTYEAMQGNLQWIAALTGRELQGLASEETLNADGIDGGFDTTTSQPHERYSTPEAPMQEGLVRLYCLPIASLPTPGLTEGTLLWLGQEGSRQTRLYAALRNALPVLVQEVTDNGQPLGVTGRQLIGINSMETLEAGGMYLYPYSPSTLEAFAADFELESAGLRPYQPESEWIQQAVGPAPARNLRTPVVLATLLIIGQQQQQQKQQQATNALDRAAGWLAKRLVG